MPVMIHNQLMCDKLIVISVLLAISQILFTKIVLFRTNNCDHMKNNKIDVFFYYSEPFSIVIIKCMYSFNVI